MHVKAKIQATLQNKVIPNHKQTKVQPLCNCKSCGVQGNSHNGRSMAKSSIKVNFVPILILR